ncbi:PHD finger protein 7-like [Lagopus muta]|uniref:PHD finger protein 7-like n=1 Tax=Lagopus muta TaxID=64668 RepID=UPI0020A0BBDE|nr:PHD finger protein 7-like [Lagopus muta]
MLFPPLQGFANGLCQHGIDNQNKGLFHVEDLIRTVRQAEQTLCFVCGQRGATITCAETGCDRSFHFPCANEGQCVTQHFDRHWSFCWEHLPQQPVETAPTQDTTCIICMEPVGVCRSYSTMVCPACQHAWFHRACIQVGALPSPSRQAGAQQHQAWLTLTLLVFLLQGMAKSAGLRCFQCPLCRDREVFIQEMINLGIHIPARKPKWENNRAYASLGVRHRRCDASDCRYPGGRERQEGDGPWQLLLCSSCAAQGTHRLCSNLSLSTTRWECNTCAGEGIASSTNADSAGPNTTSQQGLGPSQGPTGQESSSSNTTNQAPSGPDHSSQVPEPLSGQTQRARTRSRSPLDHRAAETNSQPQRRRRSRSRRRRPAWGRSRSRVPRGARNINRRPH